VAGAVAARPGGAVLVVNPTATKADPALRAAAVRTLARRAPLQVHATKGPGDARALAARAVAAGAAVVVVLGGDGTVSEVAQAVSGTGVPLVPLPAGSTNVFARALGWPAAPHAAVSRLGPALDRCARRELVVGRLIAGPHDRPFVVNAGMGLDAEVVHAVESRPALKRLLRQAAFAGATAGAARRLAREAAHIRVSADGGPERDVVSLVAACGTPYSYVGPLALDLLPGAAFDGRLRWGGLPRGRLGDLAAVLAAALRGGGGGPPGLVGGWARRSLLARADRPVAIQADGEPLGWHADLRLEPGPRVVVLLPPDASGSPTETSKS
jgi:diacylglycerol kinase family enzyme